MKLFRPNARLLLPAAALLALLSLAACGPPSVNKDVAYGVWLGTSGTSGNRVLITFIAPDKVEVEYPDAKEEKKGEGKWEITENAVKVTLNGSVMMLKLSYVEVNDEKKERLTNDDGTFVVTKV